MAIGNVEMLEAIAEMLWLLFCAYFLELVKYRYLVKWRVHIFAIS